MKERRDLYEQSKSKTVLFTSSTSPNLKYQQVDNDNSEEESHFTGLYRCTLGTLNDLQDDFTHYGEDEEICTEATIVGNGLNFHVGDRDVHAGLVLRNLQFDLSSLRIAEDADYDDYENDDEKEPNNRNNYLYANYRKEHYVNNERRNWEIVRARLPDAGDFNSNAVNTDGSLTFESVFQTWNAFDWNECDFCCCTKADYERKGYSDDAELFNTNYEYRHAYVRTMARSFVVDEHTGDIFVSWEGFYRDCDDDDDDKRLQWTLGVSRLRMEDPTCVFLNTVTVEVDNFVRCTVPVSIVFQSARPREAVLPSGGFAVIPASQTTATGTGTATTPERRIFLLSVMYNPNNDFKVGLTSRVWAFLENAIATMYDDHSDDEEISTLKSNSKSNRRQDLTGNGTLIDSIHVSADAWDGGSLRLNYNPQKGRPDYFCRTVFDAGIECVPIDISVDDDTGFPMVTATASTRDVFLTKDQTKEFCRIQKSKFHIRDPKFARESLLTTGLDVQWDPFTGEPHRIFFGCYGGENGSGNFGSVQKDGNNLKQVMEYAYTDAVLFLPSELEGTLEPRYKKYGVTTINTPSSSRNSSGISKNTMKDSSLVISLLVLLGLVAAPIYYYKRRKRHRFASSGALQYETGFRTPYVELQSMNNDNNTETPVTMAMAIATPSFIMEDEEQEDVIIA